MKTRVAVYVAREAYNALPVHLFTQVYRLRLFFRVELIFGTPKMLKWGSKMRPPFLDDLGKESRTIGQPTRESKAFQILKIPMFRALLKTRPFLP